MLCHWWAIKNLWGSVQSVRDCFEHNILRWTCSRWWWSACDMSHWICEIGMLGRAMEWVQYPKEWGILHRDSHLYGPSDLKTLWVKAMLCTDLRDLDWVSCLLLVGIWFRSFTCFLDNTRSLFGFWVSQAIWILIWGHMPCSGSLKCCRCS